MINGTKKSRAQKSEGGGFMLKIGDRAPDFELNDHQGRRLSLAGLLKDGPLVLYFYPADFTPACTKEACMFRDAHQELAGRGIRVVGINASQTSRHARFAGAYSLPFPLLSDPDRKVIRSYGASGLFGFVKRITYLIGKDGRILDVVHADFRVSEHKDFVSRALAAFQDEKQS
jgi:thioredoxin-dependent peroxiredoxin